MKRKCLFLAFAIFFWALFLSCDNAFLPVPGYDGMSRGGSSSEVPVELNASQGYKREITFTWTPVAGAIRYNIYKSDTPGGDFQIIAESSSDAAMQTIIQPQGTDAWYRVAAVKYNGVKEMSHPVRGTTLAQPIITDVEGTKGNADSEIWVYWYMGNDDAYKDSVMYTVYAYEANSSVPLATKTVGGNTVSAASSSSGGGAYVTAALFENLDPNRKYFFEVEAYNINEQSKIEKSPKQDAETARRLRPNAPKNLKISQGDSKDTIDIQFDLPVKVDVNHGSEDSPRYYEHDLFFKIYKRKLGNNDWVEICSYFGKDTNNGTGTNKVKFKSAANKNTEYSTYEAGYTVVYEDKNINNNLERGVKYEYKVQAFQDTSVDPQVPTGKNKISESTSTDKSISYGTGWTINVPLFFTRNLSVVTNENKTEVTAVSVGFGMEFETYELYDKYQYLIVEYSQAVDRSLTYTGRKKLCASQYELENFTYNWSKDASDNKDKVTNDVKNYVYVLYLFNSSTDVGSISENDLASKALDSATAHGRISVCLKPGEKPKIEMFSLTSGYADKFVISWKYNDDYEYELYYKESSKSSFDIIIQSANNDVNKSFLEAIQKTPNGGTVEFAHSADAGVERTYYLRASSGVYSTDTPQLSGKTLSKPDVYQDLYDYDKVGVKWLDTKDAKKFEFEIEGVNNKIEKNAAKTDLTQNEQDEWGYVFEKTGEISDSYKDATLSGKPMSLKVVAIGDVKEQKLQDSNGINDQTAPANAVKSEARAEKTISVHTLGPALTNPTVTEAASINSINFTWKKLEGAKAYMVVRKGYEKNVASGDFDDSYYLVDVTKNPIEIKLSNSAFSLVSNSAQVSFSAADNTYTLTDTAVAWPSNEGNGWQKAQSRIKWGVPNKYFVLPLKDTTDSVVYDKDKLTKVTVGNGVEMSNIDKVEKCGSAIGYGWNVTASKGVELSTTGDKRSNTSVTVKWDNPYLGNYSGNVRYSVYRKKEDETKWDLLPDAQTVLNTFYSDETAAPGVVYEYAVGVSASGSLSNPTTDSKYIAESDKKVVGDNNRTKGEKLAAGFVLPRPSVVEVSRDGRIDKSGFLAEDVEWSAVYVGNKLNRMIDGYIIEVFNRNLGDYKAENELAKENMVWEELAKISFGSANNLNPTPKSKSQETEMKKEATSYTTSFNTGTDLKTNKLKILFDYKHWFRVRAYTDDAETGITVSDEYKPSDAVWDYWRPDHGEGSSGYKWGTRGMTHEEFKYAACWLLAQGVNKVGWQSTLSWWNSGNGFFSKSTSGVGGWGFAFNNFSQASFLRADGRLGAETSGAGKKPRYYYTMMGDTADLSGDDNKALTDILASRGVTKKTVWYLAKEWNGVDHWDKDTGLAAKPGDVSNDDYNRYSNHGWWNINSREMIFISPGDESWYKNNGIENHLFDGYIYIYNMPDTDETKNKHHKRWIDTFMFKGYKLNNILNLITRHTCPDYNPPRTGDEARDTLAYKERHFQEIPYLPKSNRTFDPYK